eukprot:GEMP01026177.1.p1 GENE.GEMP01026177.1~~GEMP01026177.1.p1  ORF type:complete len:456 (+),score=85.10 GEMP01026177.1:161-1528(+)
MPAGERSKTPRPRTPDRALFDCSKVVKKNVDAPRAVPKEKIASASKRQQSPVPRRYESASSATRSPDKPRRYEATSSSRGSDKPRHSKGKRSDSPAVTGERLRMRDDVTPSFQGSNSSGHESPRDEIGSQSPEQVLRLRQNVFQRGLAAPDGAKKAPVASQPSYLAAIWNFCRSLCLTAAALGTLCGSAYFAYTMFFGAVIFCDTGATVKGCTPCPQYGECSGGTVQCQSGYEVRGVRCVKDRRLASRAKLWFENLENHLAYLNGMAKCYDGETGMLDEHDVKQHLADTYGGTHLEDTFTYMKQNLPQTIRRTGTVYDTTRIYIPYKCRIEQAFWQYIPPVFALLAFVLGVNWLYNNRQRNNQAYAFIKEFIETQTTTEPRLSGPSCADITQFGCSIGLAEAQCRAILKRIVHNETSIMNSPDPFRGNTLMYWSQRVARGVQSSRPKGGQAPRLA